MGWVGGTPNDKHDFVLSLNHSRVATLLQIGEPITFILKQTCVGSEQGPKFMTYLC